ncbi:protein kinase domain-containing protein [Coleofasciculus sp. F4-SAH-05]|uniref:protein kinase domain-containing protein n=1 Tax=Coleofasciculus sp. F4-SAH-05 TaxID=3069525 RepID=UPI0032FF0956
MNKTKHILHDRYQLQEKISERPSRQTWLALDLASESKQQLVIVKLLPFSPQMEWEHLKLFEREAQVLKNINHPRIPRYLDYFSVDDQDSAGLRWFALVQEYIPGQSLQQLLDQGKRFPEYKVHRFAEEILTILTDLHELSPPIIHRDIKPSNLILGKNNQIYLVDFGAVQDKAKAEGVTFTVVGTSGYTPPEQLWGRAVPASDLYALGATLIHLLTGIAPANLPQSDMRLDFQTNIQVNLNNVFAGWLEKMTEPALEKRFSQARQAKSALLELNAIHREMIAQSPQSRSQSTRQNSRFLRLGRLITLQFSIAAFAVFGLILPTIKTLQTAQAKRTVDSINWEQSHIFSQKNKFFSSLLFLDVNKESQNYTYSTHATPLYALNYAIPKQRNLNSFVGGVFLGLDSLESNYLTTVTILCKSKSSGKTPPADPVLKNGVLECGVGTKRVDYYSGTSAILGEEEQLLYESLNYAQNGKYTQALNMAETLRNDATKDKAFAAIIYELIEAKKYEQALKIADTMQQPSYRAIALAAMGEFEQAIHVAKTIEKFSVKVSTLDTIVRELTAAGKSDRALAIAETIQSYYGGREKMLDAIANYGND